MLRLLALVCAILGISIAVDAAPVAAAANDAALTGKVTSAAEGAMEGVIVSAQRQGSTVTTTVVSDHDGKYSFPTARLVPGHYFVTIRAEGYQLDGAGVTDIVAGKTTNDDLNLRKNDNLAAQLNDAEWMLSIPGTDQQKKSLLNCNGCHTLQRIVQSTHTPDEWMPLFDRMAKYCPCSTPSRPFPMVRAPHGELPLALRQAMSTHLREHQSQHQVELGLSAEARMPRATGKATHVHHHRIPTAAPDDRTALTWWSTRKASSRFSGIRRQRARPARSQDRQGRRIQTAAGEEGRPGGHAQSRNGAGRASLAVATVPGGVRRVRPQGAEIRQGLADSKRRARWRSARSASPRPAASRMSITRFDDAYRHAEQLLLGSILSRRKLTEIGPKLDPATQQPLNAYGIPVDHENNLYMLDFGSDKVSRIGRR